MFSKKFAIRGCSIFRFRESFSVGTDKRTIICIYAQKIIVPFRIHKKHDNDDEESHGKSQSQWSSTEMCYKSVDRIKYISLNAVATSTTVEYLYNIKMYICILSIEHNNNTVKSSLTEASK